MTVPFLSSICTVSFAIFIRNLRSAAIASAPRALMPIPAFNPYPWPRQWPLASARRPHHGALPMPACTQCNLSWRRAPTGGPGPRSGPDLAT
eukprot:365390-Chlamydomonas_euryale.AAC.6